MIFHSLGGHELLRLIVAIVASYLLALPLGWERKRHAQAYIGLRVFPLVAVGACVYVFLGQQLFTGEDSNAQAEVLQGLMTGIGFVGAGAILKQSHHVRGVATAAAIWTTAAIGAAVAYGMFPLAIILSLTNLFVLSVTWRLARRAQEALESQHERAENE
jgi:putative Mg2+ transporter-C (MgtC) family protein